MNKVYVDKARLLRRAITISWITLALCFVVKIFGGNFFEIMCDNPNYKALCEYADSHLWLKYILFVVSSIVSISLYLLAIIKQYKFTLSQWAIFLPTILISSFIKLYSNKIGLVCDLWIMFVLPFIFSKFKLKSILSIFIGFFLNFSFQLVSLLTKNLSVGFVDDSTFIGVIYMIDLYLMCLLYYLYTNYKKEKENMGGFFVLFAGKPVDKLRAMKAKREAKIKKLEAEVNAIEVEISKRKNAK
jgi:hypothetical protein